MMSRSHSLESKSNLRRWLSALCAPPALTIQGSRCGFIRISLKGNVVSKDIAHLSVVYTGCAATDRRHPWAHKAITQAQSAYRKGFYTIVARRDDDEIARKHLLSNGWTRQQAEMMQSGRERRNQSKLCNAKEREQTFGQNITKVYAPTRGYAFTADPMAWSTQLQVSVARGPVATPRSGTAHRMAKQFEQHSVAFFWMVGRRLLAMVKGQVRAAPKGPRH